MNTQDIIDAFEFLDTWEERFDLVVDLSRELAPLPDSERTDENLVAGCTTRTWVTGRLSDEDPPVLQFRADAETPLVRGLVALLLMPFRGKTPGEVLDYDPRGFIDRLGLEKALTAKRRAGMQAFLERIKGIARECSG